MHAAPADAASPAGASFVEAEAFGSRGLLPGPLAFSRQLFVTYVDDELLVLRDESGVFAAQVNPQEIESARSDPTRWPLAVGKDRLEAPPSLNRCVLFCAQVPDVLVRKELFGGEGEPSYVESDEAPGAG